MQQKTKIITHFSEGTNHFEENFISLWYLSYILSFLCILIVDFFINIRAKGGAITHRNPGVTPPPSLGHAPAFGLGVPWGNLYFQFIWKIVLVDRGRPGTNFDSGLVLADLLLSPNFSRKVDMCFITLKYFIRNIFRREKNVSSLDFF